MVVQTHSHRVAPTPTPGAQGTSSISSVASNPTQSPNATMTTSALLSTPTTRATTHPTSHSNESTIAAPIPSVTIKRRSANALRRERLRANQKALDSKLLAARKRFEKDVDGLGKEYQKSTNEIRGRALLRNKYGIVKRNVNSYNAYRHKQSKARKEAKETPGFTVAQKLNATAYQDADAETIAAAKSELEKEKEERSGYVHKTLRGRVQHADRVIRGIDQAVKELNTASGVECICIFVNGSNRDHPLLQAAYTPKGIDFLEGPLKKNLNNLLQDFQTFAQGGTEDLAKGHRELQKELREQVSARLLCSLQEATGSKCNIRSMKYEDYEDRICRKYNVTLVGWPTKLGNFRSPSQIGNQKLKTLLGLLKDRTCRFEKASST